MASLADVSDANFDEQVRQAGGLVLVDFWAAWCGPCRRLHATLEELSRELAGRVRLLRLDVSANPHTPAHEGVLGLPTLILYQEGREVERWGHLSKVQLRKRLGRYL